MNVKEMHYDFQQKLNKMDSQQYRNLRVPEIDWYLNEAQLLYLKMIANPKMRPMIDFNQRSIDDINNMIVHKEVSVTHLGYNRYSYDLSNLDPKFLYYVNGEVLINNNVCEDDKIAKVFIMKHSELFKNNDFYKSSYDWREVAAVFEDEKYIVFFNDGDAVSNGTFDIKMFFVDYIKYPLFIFYGGYNTLDGLLSATDTAQDCELSSHIHPDIVDIAVMLASGNLQLPDYQIKLNKIQLNNQ